MTNNSLSSPGALSAESMVPDPEQERIARFTDTIGTLASTTMFEVAIDFNDQDPVERAIDRFMTYEYLGKNALYLDPALAEYRGLDVVNFTPRVTRAGKNSAHGVFFGDLTFNTGGVLPVAIKPYERAEAERGSAARPSLIDYFNGAAVNQLGLFSLQPAGCLLDAKEGAYTLTVLEEALTTLDSIDWGPFYPDVEGNQGMQQIWSQIARQLALLHSVGSMNHGDPAGRNIAITDDNYAFLIDWEKASISLTKPRDAEVRYGFSHLDLSALLESMCRPPYDNFKPGLGIFYGKDGDWWQGFCEIVLDEYLSTREALAETQEDKTQQHEVADELNALRASLLSDVKMMRDICDDILQRNEQNRLDSSYPVQIV